MPASARLLQKLRETWGDDVTQDLVTWVSEAQTVNRAELRELADSYFARFKDLLEQRIAASEARLEAKLEAKLEERIALSEARTDIKLASLEGRLNTGLANLRADVNSQMRDQLKWMFVFWIGTLVPLAGLIVALGKNWL
jgi:ABC-type phosphate transport system auxiliary subunit